MLVNKVEKPGQTFRLSLDGLHHVAVLSAGGDCSRRFYGETLGLLALPATFDHRHGAPEIAFAGAPGEAAVSLVERPDLGAARPGSGIGHCLLWRAPAPVLAAIARRLVRRGMVVRGTTGSGRVRFVDPEGLCHELAVGRGAGERPRLAGVRARSRDLVASADILAGRLDLEAAGAQGFAASDDLVELEPAPGSRGRAGTGSVEHVAWRCPAGQQRIWRQRVIGMGARVSPVLEGERLRSVYFRDPAGLLFEIASDRYPA